MLFPKRVLDQGREPQWETPARGLTLNLVVSQENISRRTGREARICVPQTRIVNTISDDCDETRSSRCH